jgi:hypothetical protein
MSLAPLRRALLVALASLALTPAAALAEPVDLRSPDTRDAAARSHPAQDLRSPDTRDAATRHQPGQDSRSALAQERYSSTHTQSGPRSPQPASADASGDGIAPLPFVLAIAVALIVGLLAGSGLHTVHTRRRHAAGLAS